MLTKFPSHILKRNYFHFDIICQVYLVGNFVNLYSLTRNKFKIEHLPSLKTLLSRKTARSSYFGVNILALCKLLSLWGHMYVFTFRFVSYYGPLWTFIAHFPTNYRNTCAWLCWFHKILHNGDSVMLPF